MHWMGWDEELIQRDALNRYNPFKCHNIRLNFIVDPRYSSGILWVSKLTNKVNLEVEFHTYIDNIIRIS